MTAPMKTVPSWEPNLMPAASTDAHLSSDAPSVPGVRPFGMTHIEHTPESEIPEIAGLVYDIDQTRPGGFIVVNLGFALARLVIDDIGTASGPFTDPAAFMLRRTNTCDRNATSADVLTATNNPGHDRVARNVAVLDEPAVASLRSLLLPSLRMVSTSAGDRRLYDANTGAWCRVSAPEKDMVTVTAATDAGHDLWNRLAELADLWTTHDKPGIDRFGITVTPDGTHRLWLDTADVVVTTLP